MLLMEPTPIGPEINIVESFDGQAYPRGTNICSFPSIYKTLCKVEHVLSDDSSSSEQEQDTDVYNAIGKKRPIANQNFVHATVSPKKARLSPSIPSQVNQETHTVTASPRKKGSISKSRFRNYQSGNWEASFRAMEQFRNEHNHCFVPHDYPENPALSSWVKRQRYQYKLKQEGRSNTLTSQRQFMLEGLGFVWDSHKAIWEERYSVLCQYRNLHGHTNVPVNFKDKALAIWVKCQRRQYKLRLEGRPSSMTADRIAKLEGIGFVWMPRVGRGDGTSKCAEGCC